MRKHKKKRKASSKCSMCTSLLFSFLTIESTYTFTNSPNVSNQVGNGILSIPSCW